MNEIKRRRLNATSAREMWERFADSGLSVQAFCEHEAISTAGFYRWFDLKRQRSGGCSRAIAAERSAASRCSSGVYRARCTWGERRAH